MTAMIPTSFGIVPPEVNSELLYSGAGPTPMLTAAASWQVLARELSSTAHSYAHVIDNVVSDSWRGTSASQMHRAAQAYISWLYTTADHAEQTASQIQQAVSSYELAHQGIIPPDRVHANRQELRELIATNILGQNTPAIADNWDRYYTMWVTDAIVMDHYAHSAYALGAPHPFIHPPHIAHLATGTETHSASSLASIAASPTELAHDLDTGVHQVATLTGATNLQEVIDYGIMVPRVACYAFGLANAGAGIASRLAASAAQIGGLTQHLTPAMGDFGALAHLGQAGTIGVLSVPHSWAHSIPASPVMNGSTLVTNLHSTLGHHSSLASAQQGTQAMVGGFPGLARGEQTRSETSISLPRADLATHVIPLCPAAG